MAMPEQGQCGLSLVELVIVLALVLTLVGMAMPVTARLVEEGRARQAALFLAGELRGARQRAVYGAATVGIVFDLDAHGWSFRLCTDGNGDGVRRTDVGTGVDPCLEPRRLSALFPGVGISLDEATHEPGESPSTDPVRFGVGDIASFTPEGTATAGTVYLRGAEAGAYAVRVANVTGRTRVLRFDERTRRWASP